MKSKPTIEIQFPDPEPFALIVQTTKDHDRAQREQAQRVADQQAAAAAQPSLL